MPTFAELIDRLCIVTLKSIKIPESKQEYEDEAKDIMHDLDLISKEKNLLITGQLIRAILVNAIANETIWSNEAEARKGGDSQDKLLRYTHSINVISQEIGERQDLKIDCLAAEFCREMGYDWRLWEDIKENKEQKTNKIIDPDAEKYKDSI